MKHFCLFLLFSCIGLSVQQRSTPKDDHYIAAVVEYKVNYDVTANLINYANLIKEAAKKGADIVVFPEQTLTDFTSTFEVPINGTLRQHPVPALYPEMFDKYMVGISAAARENDIYVVINGRERLNCTAQDTSEYCPEEKEYTFVTNVVFDRTGAVIDRYRKINLFVDPLSTPALRPELGEFTTDFGVTFGHFICFDILFQVPALQVVQKRHLKNILFPTMWMSELPFLTAVQMQESYAYAMDVNFLAAGANHVSFGNAGSGIYSGKAGALISVMPGSDTTKVLVAKVPKVPGQLTETYPGPTYGNPADQDDLRLMADLSLSSHVSRLLEPGFQEFTLVHRDATCTFKVNFTQRDGSKRYRYRAGVFSGVRSCYVKLRRGVRMCGIYACTGDDINTCGIRFPTYKENTTAIFEELTISARMPTAALATKLDTDNFMVYPVSTTVHVMPLEPKDFAYSSVKNDNVTVHTMTLEDNTAELYSFAIWGRHFAIDESDNCSNKKMETTSAQSKTTEVSIMTSSTIIICNYAINNFLYR